MAESVDLDRRRVIAQGAMTFAGAQIGAFAAMQAKDRTSREITALGRAADWLNSARLTPSDLAGKVVVVDFCTYTCINWLRTLPYVRAWSQKYKPGIVVIGVHTPEFPFERNIDNVRRAVQQMRIDYPMVIDSDYAIWRAFKNQYWPALYFIDARGQIRDHQFGEGEYERSEKIIRRLLADAGGPTVNDPITPIGGHGIEAAADWGSVRSPENYLGYERTQNFASTATPDRPRVYTAPRRLALNEWALAGEWTIGKQTVSLSRANGRIAYRFHARDLHLVMSPPRQANGVRFHVSLDGQPPGAARGLDVDDDGNGALVEPRLYQLIRQPMPVADRTLEIEFMAPGVEAFAFTFG
jgi:thiol-disulfide isomerase/thioredoxin